MKKLNVEKLGKKYVIKVYGLEYELILPKEKSVSKKKKKTSRKTSSKVASKATKKNKKDTK